MRELTPERREELLDWLVAEVRRRGLEVPALFLAESFRPLGFVLTQRMHLLSPIAGTALGMAFGGADRLWDEIAFLFQDRKNVEEFLRRLEAPAVEEAVEKRTASEDVEA